MNATANVPPAPGPGLTWSPIEQVNHARANARAGVLPTIAGRSAEAVANLVANMATLLRERFDTPAAVAEGAALELLHLGIMPSRIAGGHYGMLTHGLIGNAIEAAAAATP